MRPLLAALLLPLVLAPPAAAETVRGLAAPSPALGREIPYTLYLPDGYRTSERPYPVLYLLHGHGGNESDWLEGGDLAATMDRLIAEEEVPPMLVVMPGMGNGWYVDNPDTGGLGAQETAFLEDFMPYVERTWRGETRREGRAVAGLSMGGFGAVRFAMLRPELFAAAASLSGALVTDEEAVTPDWIPWFSGAFGEPFDLARFEAASPWHLLAGFAAETQRPALYLTCGDDDDLDLIDGDLLFFLELKRVGVPAELRIGDGGHNWDFWSRELPDVLRFVGQAMRTAPTEP